MKIVTWSSENAPPSQKWMARFLDGKRFLPTFISAATEDAVVDKAQAFWDSETARLANRTGRKPGSTAEAIIERQGQPDPVKEEAEIMETLLSEDFSSDDGVEDLLA